MYIEIQYYDLLELLTYYKFYLLKLIYIALYIFGPVATHGHAHSLFYNFGFSLSG
jgi:hypothetical protein